MEGIDFKLYSSCIKHEISTFSSKQLQQKMQKFGAKVTIKTLKQWLENDRNVFKLNEDVYITKAGCY